MTPKWFEPFEIAVKENPLIAFYRVSGEDYASLQLATPLEDDDDAILLYLIDEKDGEFSLSDSAWICTLLPYESPKLTEEFICKKAREAGFFSNGMTFYLIVTPENLAQAIAKFDAFIRELRSFC